MKINDKKENTSTIVPALISGGLFLVSLFVVGFPLQLSILLTAGSFVGLSMLLKPRRRLGNKYIDEVSGGEYLREELDEAGEDYSVITASLIQVKNMQVRKAAEKLQDTASVIMRYLKENPEKISLAGQFIHYYQDTAASLLQKYVKLEDAGMDGETREKFVHTLEMLDTAFKRQYDRLVQNEKMDMEAEMEMLENSIQLDNGLLSAMKEKEGETK